MNWCEVCKCEYEDFVEVCADCGRPLVQIEEILPKEVEYEYEDYKLLTYCSNNDEANLLASFLESYGIKTNIKYEGTGSYLNILHGFNFQGADLLVPTKDFDEAKKVLKEFKYSHNDCPDEYDGDALKKYNRKKKIIAYFVIFALVGELLLYKIIEFIVR